MYSFYPKNLVQPPRCALKLLLIMKLTTLILIAAIVQVSAKAFAQNVTLSEKNTPLLNVFEKISDQTGYDFVLPNGILEIARPVTIDVQGEDLKAVLNLIFYRQPFTYLIRDKTIIVSRSDNPKTETNEKPAIRKEIVWGIVTDEKGNALPGATVRLGKSDLTVITDAHGEFSMNVQDTARELTISFIGYEKMTVHFTIPLSKPIAVRLKELAGSVNEVQIIGYGSTTKKLNTGNVSTIQAAAIQKQPVTNVLSALSGQVAGVFVQTNNGLPGGNISVQIRGKGSIAAGTDPLYIVDGVPYPSSVMAANDPLYYSTINGPVSPINSLNPSDIESISILKDADATAIYGSRASNGVVLITTKKGKEGKTEINLNFMTGTSRVANLPRLLNNSQYLQVRREAYKNDGNTPSADPNDDYYAPDLMEWDTTRSTDWGKYFLGGTGHTTDLQGSISGGDAGTNFTAGGNYHQESTVLPGDDLFRRGGIHLQLQHTSTDQKFFFQLTTSYNSDQNRLTNIRSSLTGDLLLPPDFPLYDAAGNLNYYLGYNPIASLNARSKTTTAALNINSLIRYTIAPGLAAKVSGGLQKNDVRQVLTNPTSSDYQDSNNYSNFERNGNETFIVEPQLSYIKSFGQSSLNILAGGTYQNAVRNNEFIRASNFTNDLLLENIGSASTYSTLNSNINYRYVSAFGRLNYNLDEKYLVNASIRRDGSSRFGPGNEFGTFGAIGAAWLFSEERWLKNSTFLSYGKLRGSYGTTGNDQIADYQYLSAYGQSGNIYEGIPTLQPTRIANADFHWETTRKLELAIELGFFKNRLQINVSRYRNRTKDQLVNYALPFLTGFSSYQANLPAVVENAGWEFELHSRNIIRDNFSWTTSFNLTLPKNRLLSFQDLPNTAYANLLNIGEPITRIYGYKLAGLNPSGAPLFESRLNGPVLRPSAATDQYFTLGSGYPVYYGGIGNSINYRNWSLDIFGQFARQFTNGGLLATPGLLTNNFTFINNRWQSPADVTLVPRSSNSFSYNTAYTHSSANFFNTSYFRVKNVALAYAFHSKWLREHRLTQLRIFVQGQNLLTFYNRNNPIYDPESGAVNNIPPMRTIVTGTQITF